MTGRKSEKGVSFVIGDFFNISHDCFISFSPVLSNPLKYLQQISTCDRDMCLYMKKELTANIKNEKIKHQSINQSRPVLQ